MTGTRNEYSPLAMISAPIVVAAAFIFTIPLRAQEAAALPSAETVREKAEEYLEAQTQYRNFVGAALVARGEEVIFAGGYGLANAEHQIPNTTQTKFRLGSITKQFTAMAILILQQQGKLNVDELVSKHVDDIPDAWDQVTIHHLLTHTSGIPSFTSLPGYAESMPIAATPRQTLDRVREMPLEFTPGEKFTYSNSGYVLLGLIIENVSGKSYEAFLDEAIFQPLQMANTGYDRAEKVLPHRASGYRRAAEGLQNAPYLDMSIPHAAGALYSTVEDLHRWSLALDNQKLISPELHTQMFTPGHNNYAYGWIVDEQSGRKCVKHGGGINGFATFEARYPDDKVFVAVLCNSEVVNPGRIANDLVAIVFGETYELPTERKYIELAEEVVEAYPGEYEVSPGDVLKITRDGNRLFGQMGRLEKLEMHAESETVFHVEEVDTQIMFVKDESGAVIHLTLRKGGREVKANKKQ